MSSDFKPILITINKINIPTYIDKEGVQRLPCNEHLRKLIDRNIINLNNLILSCIETNDNNTLRWVYQNIGYSVDGYCDVFPKDEVTNPIWEEEGVPSP